MDSKVVVCFALLIFTNTAAWAYECDTETRPLSTPTDRFDNNEDGTLTDIESGLTWMRCTLGQHWDGKACLGEARAFTWATAKLAVTELNEKGGYATHDDWRIPRLPELASIIERQCVNPRVNITLFPNTPPKPFWTANAKREKDHLAYALDFGTQGVMPEDKTSAYFIRLVRGRE